MKCKRLFALLLSLCMVASTIIAVPVSAATETVVSIVVEDASDITWLNGGAAADADGIGGRDGVIELSNLANSNGSTAGVKLPNGFAFQAGDTLTYSVDVYSNGTQPDLWLRNHGSSLEPFTTFYNEVEANAWTTITKTITTEEIDAQITEKSNGAGAFLGTEGDFALYFRPRNASKVYVDNFTVTVTREVADMDTIVEIVVDDASDITWQNGGAAADADGIGGRDGVVELSNLANSNGATAGVKLPDGFAFQEGDVLTYSVDVYSNGTQPDLWLRNHGNSLEPFTTFYHEVAANTWTTITKTITTEEIDAQITGKSNGAGAFLGTSGNFALYFRPRNASKIYVDNFTVTIKRIAEEGGDEPDGPTVDPDEPDEPGEEPGDEPEENRENVIDIKAPLDAVSELTWVASASVTVSEADGIGGRDNVLKAEGLANSNNNSVGIALPDGFYFTEDDILTYSVDVYTETANNPDMWLRNHDGSVLNPVGTFYHEALTTGTWTTITKTLTYSDMAAAQAAMGSSGS